MVVQEGQSLVEDLYANQIQIAPDCKTVVNDVKQNSSAEYGTMVHEIIERKGSFRTCSFVFEYRNFNFEAHNLAKYACNLGVGRYFLLGNPHDPILVLMNIILNQ